ncbi:pantoate--beta-alanine ligase [Halomonas sp. E14]|uniref:pantoate--beta-alanine ligase n=1 Tax=Halomonas sp. E14 TaxID=3397245 RepID=UPI00403E54D2
MRTLRDIAALRDALGEFRHRGQRIGLVPTMGNLHEGHLALVETARQHADVVVATIFVNPLQFGAGEDLDAYPRTLAEDQAKLEASGCDLLFAPSVATLYPHGLEQLTQVRVPVVSEGLCGGSRPGHFDGVATVVSILFHLVQPDVACFGEKDYQQLAVIRKLVADLHIPVEVVGVPIVRANDGLALSSRNGYLSPAERATAPELHRALSQLRDALQAGQPAPAALHTARTHLESAGFGLDYLELRAADLGPLAADTRDAVLLVAARLGTTRLIDNLTLTLPR